MKENQGFFERTYWIYGTLLLVFPCVYTATLFIPTPLPLWFYFAVPITHITLFFMYLSSCENIRRDFMLFRLGLVAFSFVPANALRKYIEIKTEKKIPFYLEALCTITLLTIMLYALYIDNDKKVDTLKKYIEKKGKTKSKNESDSEYDIVLCKNEETGQDVIWHGTDRYLHMLIIGPTGCGKTSLIIIPLVLQDIIKGHGVIVIEPKGDLAEKVYAMGKLYDVDVPYFNPTFPDCPCFNPLDGKEDEVIETMTTTFNMLSPDSSTYFQDMSNNLIRRSLMVLKRIEAAYTDPETGISERPATLIALSDLIHDSGGRGRKMVNELCRIPTLRRSEKKQNEDTRDWFFNEYFADRSKVYENTSGIRTQVSNLVQNKYLRRVLNPENGKSQIDFDKILETGGRIAITTAQGALRGLSSYLGYFLIFTLQSSIFRRKGDEDTRIPCFLYIDEFQKYSNSGFSDILTQGRSYRVSALLATQSRKQITMGSKKDGEAFLEVVNANARNLVVFPGISDADAKFFSDTFGEVDTVKERHTKSTPKFKLGYGGFKAMNYPTESTMQELTKEAMYSKTDIVYMDKKMIKYRLIDDGAVQFPGTGLVSWIDKGINDQIKRIVSGYVEEQEKRIAEDTTREEAERRQLYMDFRRNANGGRETLGTGQGETKGKVISASDRKRSSTAGFGSVKYDNQAQYDNIAEFTPDNEEFESVKPAEIDFS